MRLLIIGTLSGQLGKACSIAVSRGAKVLQADDIDAGLDVLRSSIGAGTALVMIDVGLDVAKLVADLAAEHINIAVVACGMADDTEAAVQAIKAGAKEYIPLPPDPELIAAVLEAVTEESHHLVFADPATRQVLVLADQIAGSSASILIGGESGTGKELLARYLHRKSQRADKPFVSVNCAAIPENLLESELFGHEKGAFTGAIARRIGKFEAANGGSLLLDEISEMDMHLQAKLLRVLQEREIDRVGGAKPVKIDIRLIATTNRLLQEEVAKGRFREDLFFRINVVLLRIPPLRQRPADIPVLCDHFISKYSEANGIPVRSLSPLAAEQMRRHRWPGNVRELENAMHRAVLLAAGDEITPEAIMLEGETTPLATNIGQGAIAVPGGGNGTQDTAARDGQDGQDGPEVPVTPLVGRTVADVERDLIINTL
ncbi:MAG: sigma-54 dependent transcriptional regulator, partial [Alphaproteobacteria bacterium]|nr:sigma-54 dependent transcriptional regulator [Alphaproteobacteria bacterium]